MNRRVREGDNIFQSRAAGDANTTTVEMHNGSAVIRVNETVRLCHLASLLPLTTTDLDSVTGEEVRTLVDFRVYLEATGYLALKHFNERNATILPHLPDLLANCDIQFSVEMRDTRFSPIVAARNLQDLLTRKHSLETPTPFALLGAARSAVSQTLSILGGVFQLPQISASSTSAALDNKDTSPFFARTVPSNYGDARAIILYLHYMRVTTFGVVFIKDEYGSLYSSDLEAEAAKFDINMVSTSYNDASDGTIQSAIQQIYDAKVKYIVGIFNPRTWKLVLREASRKGIVGGPGYVWLLSEASSELTQPGFTLNQQTERDLAEAINGVGVVSLNVETNEQFETALSEFATDKQLQQEYISFHNESYLFDGHNFAFPGAALYNYLIYDAVMALGLAACHAKEEFFDGPDLYSTLLLTEFEGVSGYVRFNHETGTRSGDDLKYRVDNVVQRSVQPNGTVFGFESTTAVIVDFREAEPVRIVQDFVYSDGSISRPADMPPLQMDPNLIGDGILALGLTLGCGTMLVAVGWLLWTLYYRNKDVVRIAQPIFLCQLCVGTFIMASAVIPMSMQEPVSIEGLDIACMATPWLISLGFVTAFSALFSKTWRLNRLFQHGEGFRRIKVDAKDVVYPFFVLAALNLGILIAWTIIAPLQWKRVPVANYDRFGRSVESYGTCYGVTGGLDTAGQYTMVILLVVVNALALIFATYQSFRARNLPTDFNESFYVGVTMVGMLEAIILGAPILFLVYDNPPADFLVRSVLVTIVSLTILLPVFVPKYLQRNVRRMRKHQGRSLPRASVSRHPNNTMSQVLGSFSGVETVQHSSRVGESIIKRSDDYYVQRASQTDLDKRRGSGSILPTKRMRSNSRNSSAFSSSSHLIRFDSNNASLGLLGTFGAIQELSNSKECSGTDKTSVERISSVDRRSSDEQQCLGDESSQNHACVDRALWQESGDTKPASDLSLQP